MGKTKHEKVLNFMHISVSDRELVVRLWFLLGSLNLMQ